MGSYKHDINCQIEKFYIISWDTYFTCVFFCHQSNVRKYHRGSLVTGIHDVYFRVQFCVFVHTRLLKPDSFSETAPRTRPLCPYRQRQPCRRLTLEAFARWTKITYVFHGALSGELASFSWTPSVLRTRLLSHTHIHAHKHAHARTHTYAHTTVQCHHTCLVALWRLML